MFDFECYANLKNLVNIQSQWGHGKVFVGENHKTAYLLHINTHIA